MHTQAYAHMHTHLRIDREHLIKGCSIMKERWNIDEAVFETHPIKKERSASELGKAQMACFKDRAESFCLALNVVTETHRMSQADDYFFLFPPLS